MRFLLEIAVTIALSLAILFSPLGVQNYIVIGAVLAGVGAVLIYSTHGLFRNIDQAPTGIWVLLTLGLCLCLGAVWPALPMIFFYEREKTKRYHAKHALTVIVGNAITPPDDKKKAS